MGAHSVTTSTSGPAEVAFGRQAPVGRREAPRDPSGRLRPASYLRLWSMLWSRLHGMQTVQFVLDEAGPYTASELVAAANP